MTYDTLGTCGEQDSLVAFLYEELDPQERARFTTHLESCAACQTALEEMRGVRAQLGTWTLPAGAGIGTGVGASARAAAGVRRSRPWWAPGALAAAAVVLLAVAAAIANLEITYGRDGVSVRTGWTRVRAPQTTEVAAVPSTPARAAAPPQVSTADLAALEKRLRTEFQALATTATTQSRAADRRAAASGISTVELLQRVQALIDQSETRQRRELAVRVAQVIRDVDTQRQTDLVRIQQGLAQIEGSNAADRQLLNYVVRASQRQDRD